MTRTVLSKHKRKKSRSSAMTVKLLEKKVEVLSREVASLRAMFACANIPIDDEGEYKPEFIKKMRRLMRKKPAGTLFTTKEDFLKEIRGAR